MFGGTAQANRYSWNSGNRRCGGTDRGRKKPKALAEADLILLVLNQSEPLTAEDEQLLEATSGLKRIILLNKTDLPAQLEQEN